MDRIELSEKNKNKILNFGIIFVALFIAFQFYKGANEQVEALNNAKNNELKKNEATDEIAALEVKIQRYKEVFTKKDISYVLDAISKIAKTSGVKFISIKPIDEETSSDYVRSSFLITVSSPTYHYLGDFISQIEASTDIYLVGEVSITSSDSSYAMEGDGSDLLLNLRVSTISY
ncbi:MAG: type 4a pilus biogenesis protein PilO [Candidatus Omnitrophica bacterium]|jgi:Tfp pilus assembly protein PilO|nr:type 4a pilus biogenesis protein PilO [Candidatus Omnitrophota bacterium]MDD5661309.1 type 4a pilus biogenesis protein PilO [Candidatus Omnitrophota bacterium]